MATTKRPLWKRPVFLVPAGLFLCVAGYFVYILEAAGQFKSIEPHFAGTCTEVRGVTGAEDLAIAPSGLAFLSAHDRRAAMAGETTQGAIWAYDLSSPSPVPRNLTPSLPFPFSPHGLSLYTSDSEGTVLLVVNHGTHSDLDGGEDTIERFRYDWGAGTLTHEGTISSPELVAINDVAYLGEGRFYATRDHGYPSGFMRMVEDYGRLSLASVVYGDAAGVRTAAEGFRYANGVNVSPDGTRIFVAAGTDKAVSIFDRDVATGALTSRIDIDVDTAVDNIDVAPDGSLWIAAHPRLLDWVDHAADASKLSPSQVLVLRPSADRTYSVEELYLDSGAQISAATVAASWPAGGRMLMGPVFDPKFLDCTLPEG